MAEHTGTSEGAYDTRPNARPAAGRAPRRMPWSRSPRGGVEGAAYVAAAAVPAPASADRFAAPRLRPADEPAPRFRLLRSPARMAASSVPRPRKGSWLRPSTALDRALLAIEVAGALIVAWVVWQYVYTVYFDTAPRRITPGRGIVAGASRTPSPLSPIATPTFFSEVLPPLVGEGDPLTGGPAGTPLPAATATPTATIAPEALLPSRLRIPVMFLDSPVHEVKLNMGEWEVSEMDIGHHEGTSVPGQAGNMVLAGHRDINSALFRELDRLQPGDEVFVSNSLGEYRYIVQESMVVSPSQVEVMDPTEDARLTMITCTPIGLATQRLIVVATLDESAPPGQ